VAGHRPGRPDAIVDGCRSAAARAGGWWRGGRDRRNRLLDQHGKLLDLAAQGVDLVQQYPRHNGVVLRELADQGLHQRRVLDTQPTPERHVAGGGQLAGDRLDLGDHRRREHLRAARAGPVPEARIPWVQNRLRHLRTVLGVTPTRRAISALGRPAAASSMILARTTCRCGTACDRAARLSARRSLARKLIWNGLRPPPRAILARLKFLFYSHGAANMRKRVPDWIASTSEAPLTSPLVPTGRSSTGSAPLRPSPNPPEDT
jgi:hypothetical protein